MKENSPEDSEPLESERFLIPKGLRPPALGCDEGATLGESSDKIRNRILSDEVQHDGSFILHICSVYVDPPKTEGQRGYIHFREVSLDQATVDKIETGLPSRFLHDRDFAIFEDSPKARQLYEATSRERNSPADLSNPDFGRDGHG